MSQPLLVVRVILTEKDGQWSAVVPNFGISESDADLDTLRERLRASIVAARRLVGIDAGAIELDEVTRR